MRAIEARGGSSSARVRGRKRGAAPRSMTRGGRRGGSKGVARPGCSNTGRGGGASRRHAMECRVEEPTRRGGRQLFGTASSGSRPTKRRGGRRSRAVGARLPPDPRASLPASFSPRRLHAAVPLAQRARPSTTWRWRSGRAEASRDAGGGRGVAGSPAAGSAPSLKGTHTTGLMRLAGSAAALAAGIAGELPLRRLRCSKRFAAGRTSRTRAVGSQNAASGSTMPRTTPAGRPQKAIRRRDGRNFAAPARIVPT